MLPFDTVPACLPSAWGGPANGEHGGHEEHVGTGVVKTELAARTGFFAPGKIKGKLPPKAREKEGSKWSSKRGHCMFISENLPRCDMINSSW